MLVPHAKPFYLLFSSFLRFLKCGWLVDVVIFIHYYNVWKGKMMNFLFLVFLYFTIIPCTTIIMYTLCKSVVTLCSSLLCDFIQFFPDCNMILPTGKCCFAVTAIANFIHHNVVSCMNCDYCSVQCSHYTTHCIYYTLLLSQVKNECMWCNISHVTIGIAVNYAKW